MTVTAEFPSSTRLSLHLVRRHRRLTAAGVGMLLACAGCVMLRVLPDFGPGGWAGIRQYDDGVHYAAGFALLHGQLPYRRFVFLQPPGIAIVMAPIAMLGHFIGQPFAIAVARSLVVLSELLTTLLLYRLVRPISAAGAVVAAATYAVMPDAVVAGRSIMLEPLVNLACVAGLLAVRRGRISRAGAAFGIAASIKLFAFAFPLAIVIVLIARKRWADAGRSVAAPGVTFALITGPFIAASPMSFWRDVVIVQSTRPFDGLQGTSARIADAAGLNAVLGNSPEPRVLLAALVVLMVFAVASVRKHVLAAVSATVILVALTAFAASSSYFGHYGAFIALPMSVLVGLTTGDTWTAARRRSVVSTVIASTLALFAVRAAPLAQVVRSAAPNGRLISQARGCGFSDAPSLSAAANLLRVSRPSCPQWIDPEGVALAAVQTDRERGFYPDGFRTVSPWQSDVSSALSHAQWLLLRGSDWPSEDLDAKNTAYVDSNFALTARATSWQLWIRRRSGIRP